MWFACYPKGAAFPNASKPFRAPVADNETILSQTGAFRRVPEGFGNGEKAASHSLPAGRRSAKMGNMTTVAISLKDEDQHFLEEVVKSGRYLSESEVVAEALSDFRVREAIRRAKLDELRAKVQVGIEQADRGDFVEFSAEDVKREGRARLAAQQAAH